MPARCLGYAVAWLLAISSFVHADVGVVQTDGVSHIGAHDRTPMVPLRNEAFAVRFQTLAGDVQSATVRQFVAGTPTREFDAQIVSSRGPYDIWQAQCDGREADEVSYDIELSDGPATLYIGVSGVGVGAPPGGPFVMNFTSFVHAPLGSTPVADGTVFKLLAPDVSGIYLRGDFNNWALNLPMLRHGDFLVRHVPGATTGMNYKYYYTNSGWYLADPLSRRVNPSVYNNTIIVDPNGYQWQSGPFTPPSFGELTCYQIHVGTYSGLNDPFGTAPTPSRFLDIADRVHHLVDLGINCVYLNPCVEFRGTRSPYDTLSLTIPETDYGTPEDLKYMIDVLHQNGIAVVLDLMINHFHGNTELQDFRGAGSNTYLYFDEPPAQTPWGPQLDFDDPRIRDMTMQTIVMMLEEYRFDGFRVDAVSALSGGPQPSASNQLLRDFNQLMNTRYADKFIIAEIFGDDPWYTRPLDQGGLGFDAQYHTGFKDNLRNAVFSAPSGNAYVTGVADVAAKRGVELEGTRAFNYFELHDDTWPLNGNQRAVRTLDSTFPYDSQTARSLQKMSHGITLTSRGVPCILMGSEWLEDTGFNDGKIDWAHKTTYDGIFRYYQDIIDLRTGEPAFLADARAYIIHLNETTDVFGYVRVQPNQDTYMIVANFSPSDRYNYRLAFPERGAWQVVINSQDTAYDGNGLGTSGTVQTEQVFYDGSPHSATLDIPAHTMLVFRYDQASACPADWNSDGQTAVGDILDFLAAWSQGTDSRADRNSDGRYAVGDILDYLAVWAMGCP